MLGSYRRASRIVVLEPSCAAVFRDELVNLFPHDEDARRLRGQTFLLDEFLDREKALDRLPHLRQKALVHGHCHHKAIMTMQAQERLLAALGLDFQIVDSGCCGMAGAFGFEKDHYEVSVKAGERVLLPAVRAAEQHTLIVADGFSCREQIVQLTGRHSLHPAELVGMTVRGVQGDAGSGFRDGAGPDRDDRLEARVADDHRTLASLIRAAIVIGSAVAISALLRKNMPRLREEERR